MSQSPTQTDVVFVEDKRGLAAAVQAIGQAPVVGFDTEFVGESTYEPQLCLLQVSTPERILLIDPLSPIDLREFWLTLTAPGREVVSFAGRQELLFCLQYAARLPDSFFDPQVAAGLTNNILRRPSNGNEEVVVPNVADERHRIGLGFSRRGSSSHRSVFGLSEGDLTGSRGCRVPRYHIWNRAEMGILERAMGIEPASNAWGDADLWYSGRMQAPRIMRRVNRVVTNPLMRPLAGLIPPLAVVQHVGRSSGKAYRTPILALFVEGAIVTPLPYGTDIDWCLNVVAAGRCELEVLARRIEVENPRIVDAESALPLLPFLMRPGLRLLDLPGYLIADRVNAH